MPAPPRKLRCRSCGTTRGVRLTSQRCEECDYAAELGHDAHARQTAAHYAELERRRLEREAKRR